MMSRHIFTLSRGDRTGNTIARNHAALNVSFAPVIEKPHQAGVPSDTRAAIRQRCPTQISVHSRLQLRLNVQPLCEKFFASPSGKSSLQIRVVPCLQEGRFAVVTDVGRGMRWTRQRQAWNWVFAGRVL